MLGDVQDFVGRLRRVLPTSWFADVAPNADAILAGFGVAWSAVYGLVERVRLQTRLATVSGIFVDRFSADFFAAALPRRDGEADGSYRHRIALELLRGRGTRAALLTAITELTGASASVFEPARPGDTGGYSVGGVGYGVAGGWGNLSLNFQSFLKVQRPHGAGIAQLAGYGTGGVPLYGDLSWVETQVTDLDIYGCAAAIMPAAYRVWVQIEG